MTPTQLNVFIVDAETTGVDIRKDEPVQIAVGKIEGVDKLKIDVIYSQPHCPISPGAEQVHGFTRDKLREKEALRPDLAAQAFNGIIWYGQPALIVGYNILNYDWPLIQNWLKTNTRSPFHAPPCVGVLDIMFYAQAFLGTRKWPKLSDACSRLGVEMGGVPLHDARGDVYLTWKVWKALGKEKGCSFIYSQE